MSDVMYEWQTPGHKYRLCRGGTRIDGWSVLDPFEAKWAIRARLEGLDGRRTLMGALRAIEGGTLPANLTEHGVLERQIAVRRFVVLEQPIASMYLGGARPAKAPEVPPLEIEPYRERAWVDIIVIDDSSPARPLVKAGYRLTLPDHSAREATLDAQGRVYIGDVEPGKCWLELTDLGPEFGT